MCKILSVLVVLLVFGCASIDSPVPSTSQRVTSAGPQGYYERGVYVSTHITMCVNICKDNGKVRTMTARPEHRGLIECKCKNGVTVMLPIDPYSPLNRFN